MNLTLTILIASLLMNTSSVQASEHTNKENLIKVEVSEFKILGRGISDRKTNEMLVLACNEMKQENAEVVCKSLRFVYFDESGISYYVGDAIKMPDAPNENLEQKAVQLQIRDYLSMHETEQSHSYDEDYATKLGMIDIGLLFLAPPLVILSGIIVPPVVALYLVLGVLSVETVLQSDRMRDYLAGGVMLGARVTDQGEWNWSQKPKKIHSNKFQAILSQVLSQTPIKSVYAWAKVQRKKQHLESKGVNF